MSELNTEQEFEAGRQAAWNGMREHVGQQDDLETGRAAIESSQGYREMVPALPIPKEPAGLDIVDDREGFLRSAADELSKGRDQKQIDREGRAVDTVRQYTDTETGKPKDSNETVSAEQAAADLQGARNREESALELAEQAELQRAIDELRGTPEQPQPQQQPVQQQPNAWEQQPQPQPAQQPPLTEQQRMARVLEENPQLLAGMQATIEAEQQKYAAAVHLNSQAAMAHVLASYPEINGIADVAHLQGALHAIKQQNPARAAEITEAIARTRNLVEESQRVSQAQERQQTARVQQWVHQYNVNMHRQFAQHDLAYDQWSRNQGTSPDQQEAIRQEVTAEFRRQGWNDQQIAHAYNTNEAMRSFAGQVQMHQAAAYRLQQKTMANVRRNKLDRTPPHVVRPGSPLARASDEDYTARQLNKGGGPLSPREAAALVLHQRAQRARGR